MRATWPCEVATFDFGVAARLKGCATYRGNQKRRGRRMRSGAPNKRSQGVFTFVNGQLSDEMLGTVRRVYAFPASRRAEAFWSGTIVDLCVFKRPEAGKLHRPWCQATEFLRRGSYYTRVRVSIECHSRAAVPSHLVTKRHTICLSGKLSAACPQSMQPCAE